MEAPPPQKCTGSPEAVSSRVFTPSLSPGLSSVKVLALVLWENFIQSERFLLIHKGVNGGGRSSKVRTDNFKVRKFRAARNNTKDEHLLSPGHFSPSASAIIAAVS